MTENGKQNLDSRIQVIFACAMDYTSWRDEGEQEDEIKEVTEQYSISAQAVEQTRSWWFLENNTLLKDLGKAMVEVSKAEGLDSDEIETIEAQFESDVFCADLIMFLGRHLFGELVEDDDVQFAETIQINDVDPDDLNPHFAKFLKSSVPMELTRKFFSSPSGLLVLESV